MMYARFPLSLRNVEDLLHERGINICHETVRFWWNRFGPMFAAESRKQRVDRMRVCRQCLATGLVLRRQVVGFYSAVDTEVLESFVTKRRNKKAALKFLKKTLKRHGQADAFVTDLLRSYGAALRDIGASDCQETGRWVNNRAGNSHQPFRRREREMLRFRGMGTLQKLASAHASVSNHFNQERSLPN